jgi:hypothetical protein
MKSRLRQRGLHGLRFCDEPQHHIYVIGESSLVLSHAVEPEVQDLTFAEDVEINDVCKMIPSTMTRKTKNLLTRSGRVYINYSSLLSFVFFRQGIIVVTSSRGSIFRSVKRAWWRQLCKTLRHLYGYQNFSGSWPNSKLAHRIRLTNSELPTIRIPCEARLIAFSF